MHLFDLFFLVMRFLFDVLSSVHSIHPWVKCDPHQFLQCYINDYSQCTSHTFGIYMSYYIDWIIGYRDQHEYDKEVAGIFTNRCCQLIHGSNFRIHGGTRMTSNLYYNLSTMKLSSFCVSFTVWKIHWAYLHCHECACWNAHLHSLKKDLTLNRIRTTIH